jgi:endonuclease-3
MNMILFEDGRLEEVHAKLLAAYGSPPLRACWDPLKQLIYSMLSSRTRTETSHKVLHALESRFKSWEHLRDAPELEVLHVIAPVTFPDEKAPRLQRALRRITRQNQGRLSLDFMHGQPIERIRRWLETFEGVGPKTSASVVNFSTIRGRALVVDSHHHRIALRLHLVPQGTDPAATEQKLLAMSPSNWGPGMLDDHHSLVKLHGQRRCTKLQWQGNCSQCPLLTLCPTGQKIAS